jgi:mono/diheme cytochrome c family protein
VGTIYATHLDAKLRGEIDPRLAEVPFDPKVPFNGTRSEAQLKQRFREPAMSTPALAASIAVVAKNEAPDVAPEVMAKARRYYAERCASCHGDKGNGDGPGAFAIKPRPRDYTDPQWQTSVTDEELAKAIVKGGAAVGKSTMMPANYDLRSKPELTAALVALVRSFASP